MQTLADRPPEGWKAELLSSHAEGSLWAKWRAYQRARGELRRRCAGQQAPDVVHVHVASDWSWRRKSRMIREAQHHNVSVVVHLHSGQSTLGSLKAVHVEPTAPNNPSLTQGSDRRPFIGMEGAVGTPHRSARVVGNPLPSPNPLRSASRTSSTCWCWVAKTRPRVWVCGGRRGGAPAGVPQPPSDHDR